MKAYHFVAVAITGVTAAAVINGTSPAFWTTEGSDSATLSVAGGESPLELRAEVDDGITLGGTSVVRFSASNPADYPIRVGTLELVGVTVDEAHGDCDVTAFTMDDVLADEEVPAGTVGAALAATGTLEFANTTTNQDSCKGAVLTLNIAVR